MTADAGIREVSAPIAGWPGERAARRSLGRVLLCAVVTRVALWGLAYFAVRHGRPPLHPRAFSDFGYDARIVGWLRWDAWWYVSVVENGYQYNPFRASNVAFLPGFPVAVMAVRRVVSNAAVAALLVANVSFLAAVAVLWDWVRERGGLRAAERAALWLLLFPVSFFLNSAYAEALFFVFCTLALRRADEGRWRTAGLYASLATITRPFGILLAAAFAAAFVRAWSSGRNPWRIAPAIFLPIAALGSYAAYLWFKLGSPWLLWSAHETGWSVAFRWQPIHFPSGKDLFVQLLYLFEVVLVGLLLASLVRVWKRLGLVSAVYAVSASAVGLFFGGDSLAREALAVVPAFAACGLTSFRPDVTLTVRLCAALLSVIFAYGFVMGYSMG